MDEHLTPAMRQYMDIKNKYPDCIVMFRMGDFYEMFFEDAKISARELDITLTSRGKGEKKAPLSGIPFHSITPYITKLVKRGYKVCMVEQVEDPKKAKGIVKRDVFKIITPGTLMEDHSLEQGSNNYLCALNSSGENIALAFTDLSTGEFFSLLSTTGRILDDLAPYAPAEIILPLSLEESTLKEKLKDYYLNHFDDRHFYGEQAKTVLSDHFENAANLSSYDNLEISSAGALLAYLTQTQKTSLKHIRQYKKERVAEYLSIDSVSLKNLNIISDSKTDNTTLVNYMDETKTAVGARLLKKWLLHPLLSKEIIEERQEAVQELLEKNAKRLSLQELFVSLSDCERLLTKVSLGSANPKDVVSLRSTLQQLPAINQETQDLNSPLLNERINELTELTKLLSQAVKEEPATSVREGNIIANNYHAELDELRELKRNAHSWLVEFETQEKEKTGIKFLKVKYNRVFGYFIEVAKSNISFVPDHYTRKQTQANSERYITPELKEQENKILTADERINEIEYTLFMDLLSKIKERTEEIQETAHHIAQIDVLANFASLALKYKYVRPTITTDYALDITNGRHPLVERLEERFVANHLSLSTEKKMMIITGPNMAGKSVYIKQNALIILLAQTGAFVPAEKATIGITDKLFSRVGASDNIAKGESTFMVEMSETASILRNATKKSFLILDEIGRGTSTYDGVSLAWSIAEYIISTLGAKTLFATHYHQLNNLAKQYPEITNYNIAVSETEEKIIFLRKIVEGGTDKSYGIQVAKLAGLPKEVIAQAKKIIGELEVEDEVGMLLHKKMYVKSKEPKNEKEVEKEVEIQKEKKEEKKGEKQEEKQKEIQKEKQEENEQKNLSSWS